MPYNAIFNSANETRIAPNVPDLTGTWSVLFRLKLPTPGTGAVLSSGAANTTDFFDSITLSGAQNIRIASGGTDYTRGSGLDFWTDFFDLEFVCDGSQIDILFNSTSVGTLSQSVFKHAKWLGGLLRTTGTRFYHSFELERFRVTSSTYNVDLQAPSDGAGTMMIDSSGNNLNAQMYGISTAAADIWRSTGASTPPVANAGADRNVVVGTVVTADGSATTDADSYSWALSAPSGSTATLTNGTTASPSFTPDVEGAYTLTLTATNAAGNSTDSVTFTATATAVNTPPTANAGANVTVNTGATQQISGAASSDADGDSLNYTWRIASSPSGGDASLSALNIVNPVFTAGTVTGVYRLGLIVNDGTDNSTEAFIDVTVQTPPPPAPISVSIQAPGVVLVGETATISATGSY